MPITKTDKASIITKSIHLFKIHGYYNTTMANIGDACGLIKGSIYHHFDSKEALALACLQHIHQYFNKEIFAIAYQKNQIPAEKLLLFTRRVEDYFLNSEGGCLLGNFSLEISNNIPLLKKEIIDYFNHWEEALYHILKPELGNRIAKEKAMQVVSGSQGSIMLMRLYDNPEVFKLHNKETLTLFSH